MVTISPDCVSLTTSYCVHPSAYKKRKTNSYPVILYAYGTNTQGERDKYRQKAPFIGRRRRGEEERYTQFHCGPNFATFLRCVYHIFNLLSSLPLSLCLPVSLTSRLFFLPPPPPLTRSPAAHRTVHVFEIHVRTQQLTCSRAAFHSSQPTDIFAMANASHSDCDGKNICSSTIYSHLIRFFLTFDFKLLRFKVCDLHAVY